MDIKELAKIFKLCSKFSVSEIKLGETHVVFGEKSQLSRKPSPAEVKAQKTEEKKALLQEQMDWLNEEAEVSHLEDPLAYEDALTKGLLIREETEGSGPQ